MSEPTTPAEWNKAVAKAVGLKCKGEPWYPENGAPLRPWTDIAAALWALNKLCDDRGWAWAMFRNRPNPANAQRFGCVMGPNEDHLEHCDVEHWYVTLEEPICRLIVEAAG